jgi:hypothetical protein
MLYSRLAEIYVWPRRSPVKKMDREEGLPKY